MRHRSLSHNRDLKDTNDEGNLALDMHCSFQQNAWTPSTEHGREMPLHVKDQKWAGLLIRKKLHKKLWRTTPEGGVSVTLFPAGSGVWVLLWWRLKFCSFCCRQRGSGTRTGRAQIPVLIRLWLNYIDYCTRYDITSKFLWAASD